MYVVVSLLTSTMVRTVHTAIVGREVAGGLAGGIPDCAPLGPTQALRVHLRASEASAMAGLGLIRNSAAGSRGLSGPNAAF